MMHKIFQMMFDPIYIFSNQTNPDSSRDSLTAGHTHDLSCLQEEDKGPLACGEWHVR
jgi:hypothetical protein